MRSVWSNSPGVDVQMTWSPMARVGLSESGGGGNECSGFDKSHGLVTKQVIPSW